MDDPKAGLAAPLCPWCSAELTADADTCPSCGATLTSRSDPQIPGVTTVTGPGSSIRQSAPRGNRLMRWISGEPDDSVTMPAATPGSLALPSDDVQREIRRLEIEAELTNLSAEASAIAAEDAVEAQAANDEAGAEAALRVVHDARAVTEAIERADTPAALAAEQALTADVNRSSSGASEPQDSAPEAGRQA